MSCSIKNFFLIGLGISKIALESMHDIVCHSLEKSTKRKDMVDDFLGTSTKKQTVTKKNKNRRHPTGEKTK